MKKFQFLLLDAGPIIKLFELDLWGEFVSRCDVTVCRTVAEEAKWASQEFEDVRIDLGQDERIQMVDAPLSVIQAFHSRFDASYKAIIHDGEKETLAFLSNSSQPWRLCSSDAAVFRVLGLLGNGERGISLEELLNDIGLGRALEWEYSACFRRKYTALGQTDAIQGTGLR